MSTLTFHQLECILFPGDPPISLKVKSQPLDVRGWQAFLHTKPSDIKANDELHEVKEILTGLKCLASHSFPSSFCLRVGGKGREFETRFGT